MGAPSKFTEDRVEQLLQGIRETGSLKAAWKVAGIDKRTYYRWLNTHAPLVAKVADAQDDFQRGIALEFKEQAWKQLKDYLYGRAQLVTIQETERTEDILSPEGLKIGVKTTKETRKTTTTVPCPQWAIERVLGKPLALGDAIAAFIAYGYKVEQTPTGYLLTDLRAMPPDGGEIPH
jgi:hypothetical protein